MISKNLNFLHENANFEVEIRLGSIKDEVFIGGISKEEHSLIISELEKNSNFTIFDHEYTSIKYQSLENTRPIKTKRKIEKFNSKGKLLSVIYDFKYKLDFKIFYPEPLKLNISIEEPLQDTQFAIGGFNPTYSKYRNRISYKYSNHEDINIDVSEIKDPKTDQTNYDIELEFTLSSNFSKEELERKIKSLFFIYKQFSKILKGSEYYYDHNNLKQLILNFNKIISNSYNDYKLLLENARPRNVLRKDLIYTGIVGNPETRYSVSAKVDGLRSLLIVDSQGLWSVKPMTNSFNFLFNIQLALKSTNKFIDILKKYYSIFGFCVFDCEEIMYNNIRTFVIYDCIAINNKNIMTEPLISLDVNSFNELEKSTKNSRLSYCYKFIKSYGEIISKLAKVNFTMKKFDIVTENNFFSISCDYINETSFNYNDKISFDTDGLIWTPVDVPYNFYVKKNNSDITKTPDILKWKPLDLLTIDFLVKKSENNLYELYSFVNEGKNKKFIKFVDSDVVDQENPLMENSEMKIIEFKFDKEKQLFTPLRIRTDKNLPNKINVANTVWKDIRRPLLKEDICGKTLSFAFYYHTRIKKDLFENYCKNKVVLDLGSGAGGDINSWYSLRKIYCVEPNISNLSELISRKENSKISDKIYTINKFAEDSLEIRKIIDSKVDVVTLMLSMSFLWKTRETFKQFISTILLCSKPSSKILFMTIDGDSLLDAFENKGEKFILGNAEYEYLGLESDKVQKSHLNKNKIDISNEILEEYQEINDKLETLLPRISDSIYGNKVNVSIHGKIVGENQIEYLVNLDSFNFILSEFGFKRTLLEKADKEKLLNDIGKEYSKLYTYGVYERNS